MVVSAHAIEHGLKNAPGAVPLTSRFGVEIFFIISGFVITHVVGDARFDAKHFLIRRIWRVAPLYWLTTLLVAAMAVMMPQIFLTTAFDLSYFLKSLFFIPDPLPGTHDWRPLFKLGWTLNYEIFFYAAMASLFWCNSMVRRAQLLTLFLSLLVALAFVLPPRTFITYYANLNLIPFIVGIWFAVAWRKGIFDRAPAWISPGLALMSVVITLTFYSLPPIEAKRHLTGHVIMMTAAALITLTTLSLEHRVRASHVSIWLGDISYSLYLTHMFVIGLGWAIVNRLHLAPLLLPVGVLAMIFMSLAVAQVSYMWVERPLMKRQPYRDRTAATIAAAR